MESYVRQKCAMEVTNANGRKVSLLNHHDERPTYSSHLPLSTHSRQSSHSSQMSPDPSRSSHSSSIASPTHSPRTPRLSRLDSNSSRATLKTPSSPMTPEYTFDPMEQTKTITPRDPYYDSTGSYYPAMPQPQEVAPQPYYNMSLRQSNDMLMEEAYQQLNTASVQSQYNYAASEPVTPLSPQPSNANSISTPSTSNAQIAPTTTNATPNKAVKKKYPCPHAQRYACTDTFTTSGHAARHGKKHTGEKNILCPTCNKAFTRKDNMKQHERTHKPGRDSSSSTKTPTPASAILSSEDRDNHNSSRQRLKASHSRTTTSSSTPIQGDSNMDVDAEDEYQDLMDSDSNISYPQPPARRSDVNESMGYSNLSIDTALAEESRPGVNRSFSGTSQDGEGESPGLDALAMAASGLSA